MTFVCLDVRALVGEEHTTRTWFVGVARSRTSRNLKLIELIFVESGINAAIILPPSIKISPSILTY